jgi:hypothetical protein
MLILYLDDILVLSKLGEDWEWVLNILTKKYEKVTHDQLDHLNDLGMVLTKGKDGYEISI